MNITPIFSDFFAGLADAVYRFFAGLSFITAYGAIWNIFLFADLFLLVMMVVLFFDTRKYRPKLVRNPRKQISRKPLFAADAATREAWARLKARGESSPPQSLTLALIEADSFVDTILKKMNLQGEHMADRLERLGDQDLKTLELLWRAHRVRNDLVHTPGFVLSAPDARKIIDDYESFLIEIEAI